MDLTGDVSDTPEQRLRATILEMARQRGPSSSICPSDAARAVGDDGWRDLMDQAREVARDLAREGRIEITQKGAVLDPDADWRGPIRIRTS
jgi:Protein of unknown function (DUF3253)